MFFFNFKTVNLQRKFSLDASSVNVLKTVGVNGDFATIRQAFDSVNAGAFSNVLVLSLLDSQYNEPPLFLSPSETAPTSVILKPAGVFIPTITINQSTPADTIGIFFENIRQIILLNLHLETQNALWNSALYVSEGVSVVRLDTISLNGGTAITGIEAEITEDNSALIFRACKIYNVKSGISVRGWPAFTLLHSEINHNEGAGIFLEMGFGRVRIIGNTLIGNDAADAGIVGSVYSPFCVIDSNTISNYQVSGIAMEEIDGSSFVSKNMFHKKSSNGKQRLEQLKTNIANSFSKKLPTRNERLQHFKSRKKHLQKRTQKNSAASSLFAIRNNTITFLIGEAGISALSVYESEVDISHNSITNQYGADVGIYGGSLEEVPSVAIEQNFIRNVANGIFVDIIYTSEDVGSGTVNINSNNIESGNNGLYFPDVICRHASMSMNTVRAVTEKTRERRSPTQQNTFTGDIGIFTQMEGVLEADSNSIEGFASAFELYCELLTSISGNTITETENAIYLDYDIYSDSLIIDNNIISHCLGDANILLGSFYNDEIFNSRVSISGNTIDNTNADAIENAIYIESVLSHLLEVNNNTIVHTPGVGIYLGEFEGYSEFKKNTSSKNGKEKEVRSQDKFRGKRLSGLQRKNQFDRQTHKDKRIRNRRDESSKKQPLKHLNFPTAMISLNNNSISLAQDGYEPSGVFCGGFSYASVDIRGNSIISETQEAWGMYVDNIYETYIIRIEQNSIKNVSDGLSVYSIEYSYDYEEPTILSLIGNSAENYAGNGLYIGDVDNASEITISENDLKGVSTNSILDDGITVYGDCKKIICNDNIVSNFSVGMEFYTDCLYGVFSRNQISKNVLGMSLSVNDFYVEPLISSHYFFEKNTFTFNETALDFWSEIFIPLLFRENNIRSNISNGLVIYGSSVFIQSNHLYNNGGLDLENNSSASLNAEYNWWGPTTTAEMNSNPYPSNISAIYDSFDNNSIGFVNYKNWLQDSVKILRGIILGKAFEDYEGNGLYDDEDFIENRKIILSGAANETTYTDEFGSYSFTNLLPGTYYIYQILPNDWVQTFPDSQYTIIIDSNEVELGKFFGSFKFASASGYVFNDKNGNGIKDNNEAFLENWKVKLTGVRNDSALTNSTGEYQFHQLTPGDYEIQLVLKQGWRYTHPSSGNWYRLISSGDSIPSFHFGVYQPGKISGFVFNDADSNGVRDSNEVGLSGWKVFLSGAKSDSIMSNSFGYYEFDRLFSGTYTVREQRKPQWIQTSPPMAVYQIILDDGLVHENINFGNYLPLLGIYDKNSPLQFSLSQNYPNPFNPVTHFQFSLAKEEFVSLKIYNLIGEDIATLLSKELPAGTYSVEWNAEKFSNGMYFYRLQAGKFVDAKKLLLQK